MPSRDPERDQRCPVCRSDDSDLVLELADLPVLPNAIHRSSADAKEVTRGTLRLVACRDCSHLFNSEFDSTLLEYDANYENSLHFSPTFQQWVTGLATDLVDRHRLADKTVAELGCGPGDFLVMLAEAGVAECLGFDPSYDADRFGAPTHDAVTISNEPFPTDGSVPADLVCSRHVLEHLDDPLEMVRSIGAALGPGSACYHEVPNGDLMLSHVALWDLIYEHRSYFTAGSLHELLTRAGLAVDRVSTGFGGQFLSAEATVGGGRRTDAPRRETDGAARFGDAARSRIAEASRDLERRTAAGPVVLWGAGSKGVSYLNLLDPRAEAVSAVIDVNPRKTGTAISGTGHRVHGPDALIEIGPSTVVVANPMYLDEIAADVNRLAPAAEVVALWD